MKKTINYTYKNCPVPGGGFVTGFVFHDTCKDILYTRTDIGGVYKFDFENRVWISLIDHCTDDNSAECNPLSIALTDAPDDLLIACGDNTKGVLAVSHDRGNTFEYKSIPCKIHGNMPGRATGERMQYMNGKLWFASQTNGLFCSENMGDTWERLDVSGETNLTFVCCMKDNTVIVGTNGEVNRNGKWRGNTLFISKNGESFRPLAVPLGIEDERSLAWGFVPQRFALYDDSTLIITFSQTGTPAIDAMRAYTCDTGSLFDGRVCRYNLDDEAFEDITPDIEIHDINSLRRHKGGFCGLDSKNGVIIASTVCDLTDKVYMSVNCKDWFEILNNLEVGDCDFSDVSYMKPCYNGGRSIIHWLSDIKINPHDTDMLVANTGTGIFTCTGLNMTAQLRDSRYARWRTMTDGIEETVHLNVYSPPAGDVKCLDIIGDLGGFAFTDLDKQCENSFADENGNRYITCLNADFPESNPYYIVCTPRGNWTGQTKGGIICTHDQCKSWTRLCYPYGISDKIDKLIDNIQKPNVDSGWVSITSDGKRIVWCIASREGFMSDCVVYTDNEGASWKQSRFYTKEKGSLDPERIQMYADRANENILYAFGANKAFVSIDKGEAFFETEIVGDYPTRFLGKMRSFEVRCESKGRTLWIAVGDEGLYRMTLENGKLYSTRVTKDGDSAKGIGLGKGASDDATPTLFTSGRQGGEYGFWRSDNYGESFIRISSDNQSFGKIISISGDPREFGRFYIATGSRGLIYGEPTK